jgi:hypothetical protein
MLLGKEVFQPVHGRDRPIDRRIDAGDDGV